MKLSVKVNHLEIDYSKNTCFFVISSLSWLYAFIIHLLKLSIYLKENFRSIQFLDGGGII